METLEPVRVSINIIFRLSQISPGFQLAKVSLPLLKFSRLDNICCIFAG
jgi:hypothetical protein